MKLIKKTIGLILAAMIIFSTGTTALAADDLDQESDGIYSVQYVGVQVISAALSINGLGIANASGTVRCSVYDYTVYLTVALEKWTGSSWSTITYWTSSGTGYVGTGLSAQYAVARGTYRTRSTATVFDAQGGYVEQASCYSATNIY